MPYETSALKYFVNTVTTPWGFISMYIYGDAIFNTWQHFELLVSLIVEFKATDPYILYAARQLWNIYTPAMDPFWIVMSIFVFVTIGGFVAMIKWYIKHNLYASNTRRGAYRRW